MLIQALIGAQESSSPFSRAGCSGAVIMSSARPPGRHMAVAWVSGQLGTCWSIWRWCWLRACSLLPLLQGKSERRRPRVQSAGCGCWLEALPSEISPFCLSCLRACSVTSEVSDSLWPHGLWPTRLLCPQDSPGKNAGVGCRFLQGILPAQVSCTGR